MAEAQDDTLDLGMSAASSASRFTPSQACLIVLHPSGPVIGSRIPLTKDRCLVGRESAFEVAISSEAVSRRHAEMIRRQGRWYVVDLGSTNGTFVNDDRVTERELVDGDQIRFGDAILKFLSGDNIEGAYHEEVFRLTIIDGLTGFHNQRYLLEFLPRELGVARRYEVPLSVVLFDFDDFKRINDERGHLCGDAVLKQLAQRIRPRIRREDLFARYGGEEFAAVLIHTEERGAVRFADQVRGLVAETPFLFEGYAFPVTLSAGVSTAFREPDVTVDELMRRADANLYRAKGRGRNQVAPNLADLTEI